VQRAINRVEIPSSGVLDREPQPSEIALHGPNVSIVPVKNLLERKNNSSDYQHAIRASSLRSFGLQ
jgi:hypothetical protein